MSPRAEILIIEDEDKIAELVQLYLERDGYRVRRAATGEEGLDLAGRYPPNIVVLDIALPGMDGIEVCRRIRSAGSVPIIMLTARDAEVDKVVGLEMGADDYVTKPFSPRELVARVRAILRRAEGSPTQSGPLVAGSVSVWPDRREVEVDGRPVFLTAKEFDLLHHLLGHRGLVLTRGQLLSAVWGYDFFGGERNIDAHIRTIRKKLGGALPLRTVRGVGYKVENEP